MGFFPSHLGHLSCPLGKNTKIQKEFDILENVGYNGMTVRAGVSCDGGQI
jgi:hypothetical protein